LETVRSIETSGGRGGLVEADVSRSDDAKSMVSKVVCSYGRLDILVNNAGVQGPKVTIVQMSEDEWDQVMDVNLKGAFLCSKYAIPEMSKTGGGVVTNVASNWGIVAGPLSAAYCASKGGLILLTKAMAIDHARDNIRVNCVCPGNVDTPMLRRSTSRFPDPEQRLARLGKLISPEEIAHAILYLASDDARMMTGSAWVIDNGTTSGEGPPLFSC
jgi:NAD(P)-dependent dehydrogenase (short-subunit alcohol dehydrogenase family)